MREAVIVSTARTPIGRAYKGSLIGERPDDLAGFAIQKAMENVPDLDPAGIEDVMVGCGLTHAEASFNLARQAGLAGRIARFRSWNNGEPLLRILTPDDPHGLPRHRGGRRRRIRGSRCRVGPPELRALASMAPTSIPGSPTLLETISSTTSTSRWE